MYIETMNRLFEDAYIEAAIWSSTDDNGIPLDSIDAELSPECEKTMRQDARLFFNENIELINKMPDGYGYDLAGHDFWLTRNGHGAGFWDRGGGDIGEQLSELARIEGEQWLYISDDNQIEIM